MTQTELAVRAGVSRQLVAAVEAERNVPAVDAALRLAVALGVAVEELFGQPAELEVTDALSGRLREGAPLRVGRVGDRVVATELPDHGVAGAAWSKPDGALMQGRLKLFPDAVLAGVLVAGCDPALGLAETMLAGSGPRSMLAISAPTGAALRALEQGRAHAAVVHDRRELLPPSPIPVVRVHLARWQVGLALPEGLRGASLEAVLTSGLPLVQRHRTARSQLAFERALAADGIDHPEGVSVASGHIEAARTAAMLGGIAVTNAASAHAFGLSFRALEDHVVEVWVATNWAADPGVEAFLELLGRPAFIDRVAHFGGYDLSGCGTRVSV